MRVLGIQSTTTTGQNGAWRAIRRAATASKNSLENLCIPRATLVALMRDAMLDAMLDAQMKQ
jgi:hypothetical protein